MDSESDCSGSALESVEDNGEVTLGSSIHVDEISKIQNDDGSCGNENQNSSSGQNVDSETLVTDLKGLVDGESAIPVANSPPSTTRSPGVPRVSPTPLATTKGYGLKKWRRIRRDFIRDSSPDIDISKILKRASSSSANPARPRRSVETNQVSEGSVGSVNMLVRNSVVAEYFPNVGSSLDSPAAIGSGFAVGMYAVENCEDQSSKSSTAASAPKSRYDSSVVLGNAREKNRMKNLNGKALGNSVQRVQQGKDWVETSKKSRGDRVRIEKENSHSSMESDSRSSNFVFMQGASSSAISNGKQIGRSTNHNGEVSDDEGQTSEQIFSEEHQTRYHNDNVGQVDLAAGSSWDGKEERSANHQPSKDQDPLAESVIMLQSVQEALEKEVKKFGEIGRERVSSCDTFINGSSSSPNFPNIDLDHSEPSSSDQLRSKGTRRNDSCSLETQLLSLNERKKFLENKLEEASVMLEEKGSKVIELEAALHSSKSQMGESGDMVDLQPEKCEDIESVVEALFKQKIEAEVEYLAITQKLRVAAEDQETVPEKQRAVTGLQSQLLNKLREAECKIVMLKKRAEDWETTCHAGVLRIEEVRRMRKRAVRVASCLFVQLVLLAVIFGLLILRLPPPSVLVVPT